MTAAAAGTVGQVRRDPMAMLPFCGYNMGDYFRHWLRMRKLLKRPPKVFHVNWFRKAKDGHYLWPAYETPVGWMPEPEDIDMTGLTDSEPADLSEALSLDVEDWKREVLMQDEL